MFSLRRALFAASFALGVGLGLPAIAELATNVVQVFLKTDSGVALSAADPTGTSNGAGGYSLAGNDHLANSTVTAVWCELETQGTSVTGGTVKWWKYSGSSWGYSPGLDESIPNTGEKRFVSQAIKVLGPEGRVYCQPTSVTESGAGLDGGLTRVYGVRVEKR